MSKDLKNKVVVITGGAEGIGFAVADTFLEKGTKLIILLDINEAQGAEAVRVLTSKYGDNKVVFRKCDVTKDLEEVSKELIDTYKYIDVLVNNAGTVDETSIRRTMELNTVALIEWTTKFWEHMRTDKNGKGGTIINIASIYGFLIDPYLPFYKASKHAVMGYTKSFGHEVNYNKYGVRVVAMCPGYTMTKLAKEMLSQDDVLGDEYVKFLQTVDWLAVDDVAKAIAQVFETADSGTAWKLEFGAPGIEQV